MTMIQPTNKNDFYCIFFPGQGFIFRTVNSVNIESCEYFRFSLWSSYENQCNWRINWWQVCEAWIEIFRDKMKNYNKSSNRYLDFLVIIFISLELSHLFIDGKQWKLTEKQFPTQPKTKARDMNLDSSYPHCCRKDYVVIDICCVIKRSFPARQ